MHRMLILLEGAADLPLAGFRGRTPLEVARMPNLARLVSSGACGYLEQTRPAGGLWPRSLLFDVLGIEGDELARASLEWAGFGGEHRPGAAVFHGSFVTAADHFLFDPDVEISFDETVQLAEAVQSVVSDLDIEILVPSSGQTLVCVHDLDRVPLLPTTRAMSNRDLRDELHGFASERLNTFYRRAVDVLAQHPINEVRLDLGENPGNALWLWGGGRTAPPLATTTGGLLLANRLIGHGAARLAGWETLPIQSPYQVETNSSLFDLPALVAALRQHKNSLVYVDSPRILGNFGDSSRKVKALDLVDYHLFGPLFTLLEAQRPMNLMVVADGLVLSSTGLPASGRLPLLQAGDGRTADSVEQFSEPDCATGQLGLMERGALRDWIWKR